MKQPDQKKAKAKPGPKPKANPVRKRNRTAAKPKTADAPITEKTPPPQAKPHTPFFEYIKNPDVREQFRMIVGQNADAVLVIVVDIVRKSDKLQKCNNDSILTAAATAESLGLTLEPSLRWAYISAHYDNEAHQWFAQFNMGWRGYVQLCHRTKEYARIKTDIVYEGEIEYIDRMTGEITWNWEQDTDKRNTLKPIGAMVYFETIYGFKHQAFMTAAELEAHGKKYSDDYKANTGAWLTEKLSMYKKTILKLELDKYGPKSAEMVKAIRVDQSFIEDYHGDKIKYLDNQKKPVNFEQIHDEQLQKLSALFEELRPKVDPVDVPFIERVISTKEITSYRKYIYKLETLKAKNK